MVKKLFKDLLYFKFTICALYLTAYTVKIISIKYKKMYLTADVILNRNPTLLSHR